MALSEKALSMLMDNAKKTTLSEAVEIINRVPEYVKKDIRNGLRSNGTETKSQPKPNRFSKKNRG